MIRRTRRNLVRTLALAVAALPLAGVGSAYGVPLTNDSRPDGYPVHATAEDIAYGTTQATAPRVVAVPDGFQPQLRGAEPLVLREAPDGFQPQLRGTDVTVSASGSSIEWNQVGVGAAFAVALALLSALMLAGTRKRTRMAHS